jgi:ERCC4-related helicase
MSLKPRKYQRDALEYALSSKRNVCCLPTGTGKTLVGVMWLRSLIELGRIRKALVLEPTRLLVKQTALYYMDKARLEVQAIDGTIPPDNRRNLWQEPLVVATPESAFNDKDWLNFDAVIVDECHHTVGQDAFARLMEVIGSPYRLGLTAAVPEKRRHEIINYIGPIRQWNWSDPDIQPYMPDWIGEIYEADLSESESQVLRLLRSLPSAGFGISLLERYLARDGTLALVNTLSKQGKLASEFGPQILPLLKDEPNHLHKLYVLQQIIEGHDFTKAIIFVERRALATHLATIFRNLNPALLLGRTATNQEQVLELAKAPETKLIIATSAGEEGIDLPEANLLVSWGSVASEIRFIQRHGRIMRKTGDKLKFATFIVTPGTSDIDSFVRGLERAQLSGHINIEESFGWDPSVLWPKTTWWHVTESLRGKGGRIATIGTTLGVREEMVSRVLEGAVKRGRIFYLYDVSSMAIDIARGYIKWFSEEFPDIKPVAARLHALVEDLETKPNPSALAHSLANFIVSCPSETTESLVSRLKRKFTKFSAKGMMMGERTGLRRIYLLSEDARYVSDFLPNQTAPCTRFSEEPALNIVLLMRKIKKGGIDKHSLSGLWWNKGNITGGPQELWQAIFQDESPDETPGYTLGFRGPTLEWYFFPRRPEVFAATISNMCGLLKWRDILIVPLNKCSRCGGQGAWVCPHCHETLCVNCWKADPVHGSVCWQLSEYGPPVSE